MFDLLTYDPVQYSTHFSWIQKNQDLNEWVIFLSTFSRVVLCPQFYINVCKEIPIYFSQTLTLHKISYIFFFTIVYNPCNLYPVTLVSLTIFILSYFFQVKFFWIYNKKLLLNSGLDSCCLLLVHKFIYI